MKKLLTLILLIITSSISLMAANVAEVPDIVYFFTNARKTIVYVFQPFENVPNKIPAYKIKADYFLYPFLAPHIFDLCQEAKSLASGTLPSELSTFLDTLNQALASSDQSPLSMRNAAIRPIVLEFSSPALTPPVLRENLEKLNAYVKKNSIKRLQPSLNKIMALYKDSPNPFTIITQLKIDIGITPNQDKVSYNIDIAELTPLIFPNLTSLNVRNASSIEGLINIPYPCNITNIYTPSNTTQDKLIIQLNNAKFQKTTSPIASTSKPPITPQQPLVSSTSIPSIIKQEQEVKPSPNLSYWQRWQNWIQRNKARLAITGTAAVGVTAGAYYLWRNPEHFNQVKAWFNWSKK